MFHVLADNLSPTSYYYTTPTTTSSHISLGFILVLGLIFLVLGIISIIIMWKLFTKAGKPGWIAIIPIYNTWTLFEISGKPGWWALLVIPAGIPLIGILFDIAFLVLYIMAMLELAKRFGKDTAFAVVGLILFSYIGLAILAFGDAKYQPVAATAAPAGPGPVPPAGGAPQPSVNQPPATPQPPVAPTPPTPPISTPPTNPIQ